MKKARLIYNPNSGDRSIRFKLDMIIEKFEKHGYEVTPYRTKCVEDIYESVKRSKDYDCIVSSGGDGTLNHVINAMMENDIQLPLGILPSGTANDFATHIGIPFRTEEACDIILSGKKEAFDLGKINDRYFINVAAAGLLTDVSQKIDIGMKNTLGKLAYYLKGIEQLPNFKAVPITIKNGESIIQTPVFLFLILNGSSAGGFKLAKDATANDGALNLIVIKDSNIVEMFNFFIKLLMGEHLESNNVIYLTGSEFEILCDENIETDIDGEVGPNFPLKVSVAHKRIDIFVP